MNAVKDQLTEANSAIFLSESEAGAEISVEAAFAAVESLIDVNYITGRMPWFGESTIGVPLTAVVDMETGIIMHSELDSSPLTPQQVVTLAQEANAD